MTAEYWLVVAFGLAVAVAIGFWIGRRSAPTQQEVVQAQQQRDEASAEVERVRGEVTRHFEESAQMFGRLADDYRTFFKQFAQTAQNLGLSEGRARELLQQADPKMVADQSGPAAETAKSTGAERSDAPADDQEDAMGFEAGSPEDAGGEERLAEQEEAAIREQEQQTNRPSG